MPMSCPILKQDVRVYFQKNINANSRILDVGVGEGTYSKLLRDIGYRMDGMEIWLPYVNEYKLNEKYDNLIIGNIMNYDISNYDVIILGDVLEHLSITDSLQLMRRIENNGCMCIVAVPYTMKQEEYDGNKYEIHNQSDLTNDIMLDRYRNLQLLFNSNCFNYGYYVNIGGYYCNDLQCYVDDKNKVSNRLQVFSINEGTIEYVNDSKESIVVKLDIYRDDNLLHSCENELHFEMHFWSWVDHVKGSKYKYVFSGNGINKTYVGY